MKSDVKGVFWVPSHKCWIARDIHKKTLYRGQDKCAAEEARKEYDANREHKPRGGSRNKHTQLFSGIYFTDWPATTRL